MKTASFRHLYSGRAIMTLGSVLLIGFTPGCKSSRTTPSVSSSTEKQAATSSNLKTDSATGRCQNRKMSVSQNPGLPTARQLRIFSLHWDKDAKAAQELIASDPTVVNIKDEDGRTPLAEMASSQEMAVSLAPNGTGVAQGSPAANVSPIVKLLVENGADVEAADSEGVTPLMWSVIQFKTGLAAYLIENCADVSRTMPLHAKGWVADLRAKDVEGWTALHFAAGRGNIDAAKVLLSAGAKINLPTEKGETPLAAAKRFRQNQMVQFLLQAGAS